METWPLCYRGLFNTPSTMRLFYVPFFMELFHVHETPYALRCIADDPEVITNSVQVRLVYILQSVPHPMKTALIVLPHHVALPEMELW